MKHSHLGTALLTCLVVVSGVGCNTAPARLAVIRSTYEPPVIPDDPQGLHQVTMTFTLKNFGNVPLKVKSLRVSTSSTITSDPKVPCELPAGGTIDVALTAKTFGQSVTRHAWVDTENEQLELKIRVDPQRLREGAKATNPGP